MAMKEILQSLVATHYVTLILADGTSARGVIKSKKIQTDMHDVTRNGAYSGIADPSQVMIPGKTHVTLIVEISE